MPLQPEANKSQIVFEEVAKCLACDNKGKHQVIGLSWNGLGFSYCLCSKCGFRYMTPRPNEASYIKLYSDTYWQDRMMATSFAFGTDYDRPDIDQLQLRMPKYQNVYKRLKNDLTSVMKLNANSEILEVGCAFGFSLEWLNRDFGAKVYGIEPSELSVKRFADNPNIELVGITAEEFFLNKENIDKYQFDVILYRHVFEAILNLDTITVAMKSFLKKGGILLIYSPNDFYYTVNDPFHPYVFNPFTITQFLNKCGYKITRLKHAPDPMTREIALAVKPNYEIMCMAVPDGTVKATTKTADPFKIVEASQFGKQAFAWNSLSTKEVLVLLWRRVKVRFPFNIFSR